MKIVYEPKEFEEIDEWCCTPPDYICYSYEETLPIRVDDVKGILFNCPTKIIYTPEGDKDDAFVLPISIDTMISIRRALKYYSVGHNIYIRNVKRKKWVKYYFHMEPRRLDKEDQARLAQGIKRAQMYLDNELDGEYDTLEDYDCQGLLANAFTGSFDVFAYKDIKNLPMMVTGRYEIYYAKFGIESDHRFIDVIVEDY